MCVFVVLEKQVLFRLMIMIIICMHTLQLGKSGSITGSENVV